MPNPIPISVDALLARQALFENLSSDDVQRLAKGVRECRLHKGDLLFHRGDQSVGFYIVVFGQIKLAFVSASGTEKVVEVIQAGQSFGEAVMFMDKPHVVSAQALGDALVLHVPKASIDAEIERDPLFARKMMSGMAMRLHQLMTDVEAYSLHSGKRRVIDYIVGELPESQQKAVDVVLELPYIKGVIASRLNLTQEHFSRILNELSQLGLIVVDGKRVRIPDVQKLAKHQD